MKRICFCMAAGLSVLAAAALLAGCQKKYERIHLESSAWEADTDTQTHEAWLDSGTDQTEAHSGNIEIQADTSSREVLLVGETAPAMELCDETVYVTGSDVNGRASASTSSQVVAVFQKGQKLRRTGYDASWSRVEYNGMTCYIAGRYVSVTEPEKTESSGGGTAGGQAEAAGPGGAGSRQAQDLEGASAGNGSEIAVDSSWKYAEFSKINSGKAILYKASGDNRKGITICVNAGHGTKGGSGVKTLCHPDGTPKVTGGTTGAGATSAVAVSSGMTFSDGTAEAKVTLAMAKKLKEKLLAAGYDVLMIREGDDVQLDNIARTVIANNKADCHIALHWDSTSNDKGAFYMSVPNVASYRAMEPVKSNWEKHNALGESLVAGLREAGIKIFSGGSMEMDLTQTSYSTVPSIDIELGDKASDHSDAALDKLAGGLLLGINKYFGK